VCGRVLKDKDGESKRDFDSLGLFLPPFNITLHQNESVVFPFSTPYTQQNCAGHCKNTKKVLLINTNVVLLKEIP
jgi:hypothetical protein